MSGSIAPTNGLRPDISLQVGKDVAQPINPLATFGQFTGIQNALTQNRALEAGIKQTETGTAGMEQDQALKRLGVAQQAAGALILEHPGGIPASALTSTVAQLLGMGIFKRGEVGPMLQGVPMGDSPEDTAARTDWAKRFNVQALGILEQVNRSRGMPTTMTNGQEVQPGFMSEQGFAPRGQSVQQYPSRGDLNDRVIIGYDSKTKAPIYGPKALVTPPALGGPVVGDVFGDGRIPPALRNPNAPPAAAPPSPVAPTAPQGAPTTGVVTGAPGPAETSAASAAGSGSADAFKQIAELGAGVPDRRSGLQNMLAEADKFVTGPGQENIKLGQAVLQRFAPGLAATLGITPESLAANESFDKIAARIASQQGSGSDARLAIAQTANPSSKLTPAGVRLILNQLIGNEDYIAARAKLAAGWPDQTDRNGFEVKVGANLDPRVFQYNRMTPAQKKEFYGTIGDKQKFKAAYDWAVSQQLVGQP